MSSQTFQAQFNAVSQKATEIEKRSLRLQATVEERKNRFEQALARAQEKFGTSDIAKLKAMKAEREQQNNQLLSQWDESLNAAAAELDTLEAQLQQPQNASSQAPAQERGAQYAGGAL